MEVGTSGLRAGSLLVFLWLHTKNDPSEEEWGRSFEFVSSVRRKTGVPLPDVRGFVISDGGAPSGVQRARIARELPIKSSVITIALSHPVKRGIATALSWINPRFFFTGPSGAMRAAEHVDLADQWDVVWPAFVELQAAMPPNETLEQVGAKLGRSIK
jgi:hypothetical protein